MEQPSPSRLSKPVRYFPPANGRYEVKPGLIPLGTYIADDRADQQVFQIDTNFEEYRHAKLCARTERLSKYYQVCNYSEAIAHQVTHFLLHRLAQEHPQQFYLEAQNNHLTLHCCLTGESLHFDSALRLQQVEKERGELVPAYASALDALAMQVQEDLAIICRSPDENWLAAIHLCFPNHWAAEEKIGQNFATVHSPVAGIDPINRRATAMVQAMITGKPCVRFAWGLSTDTRLNHHPQPPSGIPLQAWQGRCFDLHNPQLYMRLERQVIWGFPEQQAALFTIRTYFRDVKALKQDVNLRDQLSAAIASMRPDSLAYKGLASSRDDILAWLRTEG